MSGFSRFVDDAAVYRAVYMRGFFESRSAQAETIALARNAIAESLALMAEVDGRHFGSQQPSHPRWRTISLAPRNQDIEVCVMDGGEAHVLVGTCRLTEGGWVGAGMRLLAIRPTHWRVATL
jgi:hypothetical protein